MIGVFDSGFGGLTVLRGLLKRLPEYDYIYLGDNARAPYGNKSHDLIYKYAREAADFLFLQGCEIIIMACYTASSEALRRLQNEYLPERYPDKRILGIIVPVVEETASICGEGPVGIIGTRATITGGSFKHELHKILDNKTKIIDQACPLLVPLIEEGWIKNRETKMILKKYLRSLKEKQVKVLILGCSHYPFLEKAIAGIMGKRVKILDTPAIVARKLKAYLDKHTEIEKRLAKNGRTKFYTTDNPDRFKQVAEKFLKMKDCEVEKAELI